MDDRHGQLWETHVATMASVNSQATEPDKAIGPEERTSPTGNQGGGQRPPSRRRGASLLAAGAICALAIMLLFLLADAGRTTASTTLVKPTPSPKPTATATAFPSPTPMTGFKVYVDRSNGFVIQYPTNWTLTFPNPGAQFDDANSAYEMQVLVPGFATSAGPTGAPGDASVWVNYAMNTFSRQFQGDFHTEPGPCTNPILGTGWQCGIGDITQNQTIIHLQVNATVHNGKPYIIAEYAAADRFAAGEQTYFWPMERSFQFLPAGS